VNVTLTTLLTPACADAQVFFARYRRCYR
ncbi:hypothetical protein SJ358_29450, partial [Enterobacter hormaechei]|nr:hypothetical protein [Enterobacter hormaechei]